MSDQRKPKLYNSRRPGAPSQRGRCPGATAAHAPPSLLWCAGLEFTADPTEARTCDTQMVENALTVGGVDRPHLQSVPAAMRLIAFITEGTQIRKILDHIGVDSEPPHIAPARGPPLWGD